MRGGLASSGARAVVIAGAGIALGALVLLALGVFSSDDSGSSIVTYEGSPLRTGTYAGSGALTPAHVRGGAVARLFRTRLPLYRGHRQQVYAQPLVAASRDRPKEKRLVVATEQNNVYELDPGTGRILRARRLAPDGMRPFDPTGNHLSKAFSCEDLAPDAGITGTPVIDSGAEGGRGLIYLAAKYATGGAPDWPGEYRLHALHLDDLSDAGNFRHGRVLDGFAQNAGRVGFDTKYQLQRAGLLWLNGTVYAGFSGHCSLGDYHGWVFGIDAKSGKTRARWTSTSGGGHGGGIWMSGGGLMSDGDGRILFATGNGVGKGASPTEPAPGSAAPAGLAESVVRLKIQSDGKLEPADFFSPFNAAELDKSDLDLGSGGIVGLPPGMGSPGHPHLLAIVGKSGVIHVLDRDDLGGFKQGADGRDAVVSKLAGSPVWGKPAAWRGNGGWLYVPTLGGPGLSAGSLRYYRVRAGRLIAAGRTPPGWGFGSGAPVVTYDRSHPNATAVVWAVRKPVAGGAELRAYAPTIARGSAEPEELASFPIGNFTKFAPPGVADDRIFVGNKEGDIYGFGLRRGPGAG